MTERTSSKNGDLTQGLSKTPADTKKGAIAEVDKNIKTEEEHTAGIKESLEKNGVAPIEEILVTNPITGKQVVVQLERDGTPESKLILALADPELTRDRKDFVLSMYLYERGRESASMLVDLMRYKGEHTKEGRVFQSRIRFDFEMFVTTFTGYLHERAVEIGKILSVNPREEKQLYTEWLLELREREKENKQDMRQVNFWEYLTETGRDKKIKITRAEAILLYEAVLAEDQADKLTAGVRRMADARAREKGYGIYVDNKGRPYSVDDPMLDEVILQDREETNKIKNGE